MSGITCDKGLEDGYFRVHMTQGSSFGGEFHLDLDVLDGLYGDSDEDCDVDGCDVFITTSDNTGVWLTMSRSVRSKQSCT